MTFGQSWQQLAQKARVPAGTILGVIFLIFMHPSTRSLYIGGVITLAGALLRLWAAGHIEKKIRLAQSGPYAWTRNPLYMGSLFMALGVLLSGQGYWLLPLFILFFVMIYLPVMRAEADFLTQVYGAEYRRYASRTPLFFPWRWRRRPLNPSTPESTGFQWSRVKKNREHRNLLSLLAVEVILLLRYLLP